MIFICMKKQLNEVKRLQKIAGILKESEINPSTIKDLIAKYPGTERGFEDDLADFYEYIRVKSDEPENLELPKIHYFGGEEIGGAKSIITIKNRKTGQTAYWKIDADDNMNEPYAEPSGYNADPDGYF